MRQANWLRAVSKVRSDLHQMTRLSELIEYISRPLLVKLAFILLMVWLIMPTVIVLLTWTIPFQEPIDRYFKKMMVMSTWYSTLLQIGFLGCLIGIIILAQNILSARKSGINVRQFIASRRLPFFLLLLLFWSSLATLFSTAPGLSFLGTDYRKDGLMTYFAYAGIFLLGSLIRDKRQIKWLLTGFVVSSITVVIPYVLNWIPSLTWMDTFQNPSIFMQFNHYGYYLCLVTMAFCLLYISEGKSCLMSWIWLAGLALATAALALNSAIGPVVAVAGGLVLGGIFYYMQDKQSPGQGIFRRVWISAVIFIGVAVAVNLAVGYLGRDLMQLSSDIGNIAAGSEKAQSAGSGRWLLWQNGVRFALEKPLFGYGPDNLGARYAVSTASFSDRPHNELIQIAASLGIPAMLFYLLGLIAHLQSFLVLQQRLDRLTVGIFAMLGTYLISSLFGNSMFYTTPFFFLFLGISYGILDTYSAASKTA